MLTGAIATIWSPEAGRVLDLRSGGHPMEEIDVFWLDSQGRMTDQTVLLRPWPVVTLLRDRAMAGQLPFLTAS
jgi:hypothetical protein